MPTTCTLAFASCMLLLQGSLNDIALTPGVARTTDKDVICAGNTKAVRNVSIATKNKVYKLYGLTDKTGWCQPSGCSIDHLISLELGGSNDIQNLWPQSNAGVWTSRRKDALENKLHKLICSGALSVEVAQSAVALDWIGAYRKYVAPW